LPDHEQTEINPPGAESRFSGFPSRWMGIIGERRAPLPENLLVKWRVTLWIQPVNHVFL